ncbi:MAG: hypothetical protein WKF41_05595 [Gaiellaceae bacterium]
MLGDDRNLLVVTKRGQREANKEQAEQPEYLRMLGEVLGAEGEACSGDGRSQHDDVVPDPSPAHSFACSDSAIAAFVPSAAISPEYSGRAADGNRTNRDPRVYAAAIELR